VTEGRAIWQPVIARTPQADETITLFMSLSGVCACAVLDRAIQLLAVIPAQAGIHVSLFVQLFGCKQGSF